jgi:hypothetical protein
MIAGCQRAPGPPAGTGAEEAARRYCEALVRQDWAQLHAALHPDSRARYSTEQFGRLVQSHRRSLGFEPEGVRVRACEEHGDQAIAHVVFTGQAAGRQRQYKDAVALRQTGAGWGVVLPPQFGQNR